MNNVLKLDNINLDYLSYYKLNDNSFDFKYNNNFFIIKLPFMYLNSNIDLNSYKLEISFKGIVSNKKYQILYNLFNDIDKKIKNKMNIDKYTFLINEVQNDMASLRKNDSFTCFINKDTVIYDKSTKEIIEFNDDILEYIFKKNTKICCLVNFRGIKNNNNNESYVHLEVLQCLIDI